MKKLIKDGKVAVLISPAYGAGWSTWATHCDSDAMLFDPVIAQMILDGADGDDIESVARVRYPDEFLAGIDDLQVQWVQQGAEFKVDEYDGSETIVYKDGIIWSVAC
jgi:hypothetical protein